MPSLLLTPRSVVTIHQRRWPVRRRPAAVRLLAIDPAETNRPSSSGTGIFNIRSQPYGAQPGSNYVTAGVQRALDDAAAWGSANGRQGTVYVPAGAYTVGNLYLRSNVALYLEPG